MIKKNGHEIAGEFAPGHVATNFARNHTDRHPVEDIEPLVKVGNALRDARVQCVKIINAGMSHIEAAILRPGSTKQDIAVAFYQANYGIGTNLCEGVTMTERAIAWDVERATISKGAIEFVSGNALKPSYYMKREESGDAYSRARVDRVKRGTNK